MSEPGFLDRVQEILAPRIHYLSGQPLKATARNVYLLDSTWFRSFLLWAEKKVPNPPGPIDNTPLKAKLEQKEQLVFDQDYFIVENNVYETLIHYFQGGPRLQRPLVPSPYDSQPHIILNPIRFSITYNSFQHQKTVDPSWSMNIVKDSFCRKFNLNPSRFLFETTDNQLIDLALLAGQAHAQFDANINLRPLFSHESAPLIKPYFEENAIQPPVKVPSSSSSMTVATQFISGSSFFQTFIHCFCHLQPVLEFVSPQLPLTPSPYPIPAPHGRLSNSAHSSAVLHFSSSRFARPLKPKTDFHHDKSPDDQKKQNSDNSGAATTDQNQPSLDPGSSGNPNSVLKDSPAAKLLAELGGSSLLMQSFLDLVMAVQQKPSACYDSESLNTQFSLKTSNSKTSFSPAQIVTDFLTLLDDTAKEKGCTFFSDFFMGEMTKITTCSEKGCEYFREQSHKFFCLEVPIVKKLFRGSSLDALVQNFEGPTRANEKSICAHCKQEQRPTIRVTYQKLPAFLIVALKRFEKTQVAISKNAAPVRFSSELIVGGYRYKLVGTISHPGGLHTSHHKGLVLLENTQEWVPFGDIGKTSPLDTMIYSPAAHVLFYRKL